MKFRQPFFRVFQLFLLAALCASSPAHAKEENSPVAVVTPGVGVSNVRLGASPQALERILGRPDQRIPYAEEKQIWEKYGYDTSRDLPFIVGFDEVWTYTPASGGARIPVWKVYFKANKINIIIVSSYVFPDGRAALENGVGLGSTANNARNAMPDPSTSTDARNNYHMDYDDRGVGFLLREDLVRVIRIYLPR
jgi:hypothetical protein